MKVIEDVFSHCLNASGNCSQNADLNVEGMITKIVIVYIRESLYD